jgi:hypothetical protein
MKLIKFKQRDSIKTLASTSTDHSTSDQECHSRELLNVLELTMSTLRDGETMLRDNNGTSMVSPRPLRITNGSLTHSISKAMVDQPI